MLGIRLLGVTALVVSSLSISDRSFACHDNPTCTVGANTYICDQCPAGITGCFPTGNDVCPGKCSFTTTTVCEDDDECPMGEHCNFVGDGVSTWCWGSGTDFIATSVANQVLCTGGGNDVVIHAVNSPYRANLGAGDDTTVQYTGYATNDFVEGGEGTDAINTYGGDDTIFGNTMGDYTGDAGNRLSGGDGNDTIFGADGDDIIVGGAGNDGIAGQGGRDSLKGNAGADTIITSYGVTPANSVFGTLLCGGTGDDTLIGNGPGHQCMNAGSDQAVGGGEYDCQYTNTPSDSDAHDVGSARQCAAVSGSPVTIGLPCGCENEENMQ